MNDVYKLKQAITIYQAENPYGGGGDHFFQLHNVFESKDGSSLGAGRPVTHEALEALCKGVLPSLIGNLTYLSDRVLATSGMVHGPDVWWSPPSVRPMFFTGQVKIGNGLAPWPGLIFVTERQSLSAVFAVKGDRRPAMDSRLYVAPFFNMTDDSLCLGNALSPARNNAHEDWETVVYESAFSEDRLNEKRIEGPDTLSNLWKTLITEKATVFPEEKLLASRSPKTVGDLITKLKKGKER